MGSAAAVADSGDNSIRFQKPSRSGTPAAQNGALEFRSAKAVQSSASRPAAAGATAPVTAASAGVPKLAETAARQASYDEAKPLSAAPRVAQSTNVRQAPARNAAERPVFAEPGDDTGELAEFRAPVANQSWIGDDLPTSGLTQAGYCDACAGCCEPACGVCEPVCGCAEPDCGICEPVCGCGEPTCGICEPACGVVDPDCGIMEPGCGLIEPGCGCDDVGCGSCIGNPGPDYWCFPVCLPRLKEFSVWAGVHGFKGPRDVFDGGTDGNFGFQEGINIGGRAPLVGLAFPQLSYQLGYQAVQSRLSGSSAAAFSPVEERTQSFVTAGLFRRVSSGVQFGAVWDMMRDDFRAEEDFHQMRYELSIKSPQGREIGFWGATHTNNKIVGARDYQAVGQYVGFFRWHFRDAGEARFWGGGSNGDEGIFGADFYVPFNHRWSLNSGFNYLITNEANGPLGAQEESWNIGMNIVWHYGRTAKASRHNPHRPLFGVADNGWMFIDERP